MENKKLKKSVRIRLQKQAQKEFKEQNKGRLGDASAILRNVPTSPRKMRLVAGLIRGVSVYKALGYLRFEPKIGAKYMEKLLLSAIANWEAKNSDLSPVEADLQVKMVMVDEGRTLKRLRPAPQGRAHRIRKRSNHITMVVGSYKSGEELAGFAVASDDSSDNNNE